MNSKRFYLIISVLVLVIVLCLFIIIRNKYSVYDPFEPKSKNYYVSLPYIGNSITAPNLFRRNKINNNIKALDDYQSELYNQTSPISSYPYENSEINKMDRINKSRYDDLERPNPYYPAVSNINMPPTMPTVRQSLLSGYNPSNNLSPYVNRNPLASFLTPDRDELEYRNGIMVNQPPLHNLPSYLNTPPSVPSLPPPSRMYNNSSYIKRASDDPQFLEIGYVQPNKGKDKMIKMMKLYGRRLDSRSDKYDYYVLNPYNDIKIPIYNRNNNELSTNDLINVEGFKEDYTVKLYY